MQQAPFISRLWLVASLAGICGFVLATGVITAAAPTHGTALITNNVAPVDPYYTPSPTVDDEKVRHAVNRGLAFLISIQNPDGSWNCNIGFKLGEAYRVDASNAPHVGVTAMCCMALVAGGHTPERGEYAVNVTKGLHFILNSVQRSGQITANGSRMYSHAFATLFLAEIYGMTGDGRVKKALQESTSFIARNQNSVGQTAGGWRYEPAQQDADMSVTVCQLQALRAARNVGIAVPIEAINAARDYVLTNYNAQDGSFSYQPEDKYDRETFALAAAGVVALQSSGKYDSYRDDQGRHVDFAKSIRYIQQKRPDPTSNFNYRACTYGFWYGHYYAAQAMHQYANTSPKLWDTWNKTNREHFLSLQRSNGAWVDEIGTFDEKKNAYATAMACLILSINNGYLPIFQA